MDGLSPKIEDSERHCSCVCGEYETAYIEGISAAGKTAKLTITHTGGSEVLETGMVVDIPFRPMKPPYDTPTPAL